MRSPSSLATRTEPAAFSYCHSPRRWRQSLPSSYFSGICEAWGGAGGRPGINLPPTSRRSFLALISFSLVWTLGFGGFSEAWIMEAQADLAEKFGVTINSTTLMLLFLIAINGTLGMLIGFGAIGEESAGAASWCQSFTMVMNHVLRCSGRGDGRIGTPRNTTASRCGAASRARRFCTGCPEIGNPDKRGRRNSVVGFCRSCSVYTKFRFKPRWKSNYLGDWSIHIRCTSILNWSCDRIYNSIQIFSGGFWKCSSRRI